MNEIIQEQRTCLQRIMWDLRLYI